MLKKEQRLEQIVRLIGPDALPDSERIVLVVAEMIKNGFLQQNAFDDIDVYSVPEKQILILSLIMEFYKKAQALIKHGTPLVKINSLSVREEIIRIKTSIPNNELDKVNQIKSHLEEQFSSLEKLYQKVDIG